MQDVSDNEIETLIRMYGRGSEVAVIVRALRELQRRREAERWRPIEEAPRDETAIMIGRIGQEVVNGYRVAYFEAGKPEYPWHVEDAADGFNHHRDWPTHYRLIEAPKT